MKALYLIIPLLLIIGTYPAYAEPIFCITTPCEEPASVGFFWQLRTWIEDRVENAIPTLRTHFGESERKDIQNELHNGIVVAQERIDRVKEKLGIESIKELADTNEINKIYREFLEIEKIENKAEQQKRAIELDSKVNSMKIVQTGCERPINTMEILNSDNYYDTLKNNFCNKTLKNVDVNQARSYLGL